MKPLFYTESCFKPPVSARLSTAASTTCFFCSRNNHTRWVYIAIIMISAFCVRAEIIPATRNSEIKSLVRPQMYFADETQKGKPFAKDPDVVQWKGKYLMYYTTGPYNDGRPEDGYCIGIAESRDLISWTKTADFVRDKDYEKKGACAPCAVILKGKVHLFYQTYGNGPKDAICHAWSDDGLHFTKNPDNPIFHPTGDWTCGRAIDADAVEDGDRVLLYVATRDPDMKIQKLAVAAAPLNSEYTKKDWTQLCANSILEPTRDWEKKCIEAPAVFRKDGLFYMFYAGGYNNQPQQIGVAISKDAVQWTRMSEFPLLPNGKENEWNSSESGHPGVFTDDGGRMFLFFQGNNDNGKTWYLSKMEIRWDGKLPYLIRPEDQFEFRLIEPIQP
ncbi:MAG: family 43 glycosylhydrolase [Anaerohalosphaeraceae bacterium]